MADRILTPCNVACGARIVTVNSQSGSTLQWDTWLWDDMQVATEFAQTSAILEFYIFHITTVDMSLCTSLRNFIQIGSPSAEKDDVMSIFKKADLSHLGF